MSRTFPFLLISIIAFALGGCAADRTYVRRSEPAPPPGAMDINSASAADLALLPGIGSATAEKIVGFRDEYGPFRRTEHLLLVDGISERKFRAIRRLIKAAKPSKER